MNEITGIINNILTFLALISPYIIWYLNDRRGRITIDISHIIIFKMDKTHIKGIKASILNKGKLPIRISSIHFLNPKTKEAMFPLYHNIPSYYRSDLPKVLDTGDEAFLFLPYEDFKIIDVSILKAVFSVNGNYKYSKKLKKPLENIIKNES